MKQIVDREISGFRATPDRLYEGYAVERSSFEGVYLRQGSIPGEWAIIRDSSLKTVTHINCSLHTAILDCVRVRELKSKGSSPLFLWGCAYRNVVLEGKIAGLKINRSISVETLVKSGEQAAWDAAVHQFYCDVDWALDISKSQFTGGTTFEAVPGDKIIRNVEHQALVRRGTLAQVAWKEFDFERSAFDIAISWFLHGSQFDSVVLAARMGSKHAKSDVAVLDMLRKEKVAE